MTLNASNPPIEIKVRVCVRASEYQRDAGTIKSLVTGVNSLGDRRGTVRDRPTYLCLGVQNDQGVQHALLHMLELV